MEVIKHNDMKWKPKSDEASVVRWKRLFAIWPVKLSDGQMLWLQCYWKKWEYRMAKRTLMPGAFVTEYSDWDMVGKFEHK